MKPCIVLCLLAIAGCGQTGPLYLPDSKPPIYVPPEAEEEQQPESSLEND
jgi:predicted small lipoprotein YifL